MPLTPSGALSGLWIAWVFSWIAAAIAWSNPTAKLATGRAQAGSRFTLLAGGLLMFGGARFGPRLWPMNALAAWTLVGLVAVGLLFTWWARIHLGRYWASTVSRKEEHKLIDTGPYALVRHPIYSGVILALAATAVLAGTALTLAGLVFMIIGFWLRARAEEQFLAEELGVALYDAYRARTGMLMPFVGVGRRGS